MNDAATTTAGQASGRIRNVDIRPGVSVLSVLRHLNYRPWFALAEFIDNSLQSYLTNSESLKALHGPNFKLVVRIDLDSGPPARISVTDNAGGIGLHDYPRAFRAAAIPPDRTGLAEFGMGMKSAACWFASRWQVRTSAFGEPIEHTVRFDIAQIVHDQIEELEITEVPIEEHVHFTEILLEDLHHVPVKKTIGKIKEHLGDMYRVFLRDGSLELRFNGEPVKYENPAILEAPDYRDTEGQPKLWRKEIAFDFGQELSVIGFAALRETGSTSRAGFALFRRGRLIQGSGDEGYRPEFIFGKPNSYIYQRLFGELHLSGFEVSHTKDGFRWDENEQPFLELLKDHLDEDELPLLRQARYHRVLLDRDALAKAAELAVTSTAEAMEATLQEVLPSVAAQPPVETRTTLLDPQQLLASREFQIIFRDRQWIISIELTNDAAESQWLALSNYQPSPADPQRIQLRLSLAHPFMVRFAQADPDEVEALLRVAAALGLAETLARQSGVQLAGTIRRNLNDILREALSRP